MTSTNSSCSGDVALPTDPYTSLYPHFSMLLGVDDFETLHAYHRGKGWMHNAWLHGQGVVWGFGVEIDDERDEIRVQPGLAIDGYGRELRLRQTMCVSITEWFKANRDDLDLTEVDGSLAFDAHVIARFKACSSRPVPVMLDQCDGANSTTAPSRVLETVEIELRPGLAPARPSDIRPLPYPRLRLLMGLRVPDTDENGDVTEFDQVILDERDRISALPPNERTLACLAAARAGGGARRDRPRPCVRHDKWARSDLGGSGRQRSRARQCIGRDGVRKRRRRHIRGR